MPQPPKLRKAPEPKLTIEATLDILRTTVPRLEVLAADAPVERLDANTDYGWSVNEQLAHLRAVQDVLGGNMLRIVREDHPAWRAVSPRTGQERYFGAAWDEALASFRTQRTELLTALDRLPTEAWHRTARVTVPPNMLYDYSTLYYGDWLARHERSHLSHMSRILEKLRKT
ncbi:MAG TPA: DinB family protein [Candidatus Limnocylindria bacterium]|jgi:hypothetical protein